MVDTANTVVENRDMKPLRVGLDIGSTTVKAVVLDQADALDATLFSDYRRHHANVRATVAGLLKDIHTRLVEEGRGDEPIRLAITGSGGLALADNLHVPFIQEVIAETEAIDAEYPQADVIIELGGEDAKITYLKPTPEQRMNGSCAGGTGAFIDQMSTLLDTDAEGLNEMAKHYTTLYPIASRCGVFAKTDLQPLINDGAAKPDLAASIFTAGALLSMSAAGIDPLAVLDGAVETAQAMDIRAFENPAWLYAAARAVLAGKGYGREFLCFFDHSLDALGRWWQQLTWQWQTGRSRALTPVTALLPGDLGVLDKLAASGQAQMLETLVHFAPIAKKVPVEMDWKDYDGLGFLSGRNWEDVEQALAGALNETHSMAGVPLVDVDAGDLTAESLGSLFYFLELSSALTACLAGEEPFPPDGAKVQRCAMAQLRGENT